MKKILVLALAAGVFVACNNETKTTETTDTAAIVVDTTPTTSAVAPATPTYTEGDVIRREGKVMVYRNNDWVAIDKDITLDNGTVVTTQGSVKNKAGKTVTLEDGYYVNRAGDFFDRTGAAIDNAWDATKTGVNNAVDATKTGVNNAVDATKDGLRKTGDAIERGADKVSDKTNEVINDVKR